MFEDIKGIVINRKSERKYNDQKEKDTMIKHYTEY